MIKVLHSWGAFFVYDIRSLRLKLLIINEFIANAYLLIKILIYNRIKFYIYYEINL